MASMYDTIMELPLFKGIGEEQLSQMLEKTKVEFLKFNEGEIILEKGEPVKNIDFIIGGQVRNRYQLENFAIEIEEIRGKGSMLGAMNLFGIEPMYPAISVAIGEVSLLRIEKSQYMNILQSDKIYILNFVNFLSAAAQKPRRLKIVKEKEGIALDLDELIKTIVSRTAEKVRIIGEDKDLAAYCGVNIEEIKAYRMIHPEYF